MYLHIILLISTISSCVAADVFTSTRSLGELMKTENSVIEALDKSLEEIQKLREDLESYKKKFVFHENTTEEFVLNHISNPINSFTLIKRLYLDLRDLQTVYNHTFEHINNQLFQNADRIYPDKSDLLGIATLVRDLQVIYSLNVTDFTNGYIRGIKYSEPLSAKEVFQLGVSVCEIEHDISCFNYLKEALRKWDSDEKIAKTEIMRAISDAYYKSQNLSASLEWDNRILVEEDFDDIATLIHKAQTLQALKNGYNITEAEKNNDDDYGDTYSDLVRDFNALCNEGSNLPEYMKAKLYCFYKYGNHPFLRLAPLKMEQLFLEPDVFIVHQILSDNETAELIEISKERLRRSLVILKDGTTGPDKLRISSSARFNSNETLPKRVLRRSLDLTELLEFENSFDFQVTHYSPGGFYTPHHDMLLKSQRMFDVGNRIVTVLHYLSDVEQGGGTAFPTLGIMVKPQKGSAVYWRNLHTSGEGDIRTSHGGCPVLQGIKWVSNIWIHMKGQEEATPCGLEYIAEDYNITFLDRYKADNTPKEIVV